MAALIAVGRRLLITVGLACTVAAGVTAADSTMRVPQTAPGSYPWPLEVVVRPATPRDFGLTNYDRHGFALGARGWRLR